MQSQTIELWLNKNQSFLVKAGIILAMLFNILMFAFIISNISKDKVDYILFCLSIFLLVMAREEYVNANFKYKAFVAVSIFFITFIEIIMKGVKFLS